MPQNILFVGTSCLKCEFNQLLQQNDLDELEGSTESQLYKCFDPGRPDNTYDLALDLGIGRNQKCPDGKKTILSLQEILYQISKF
ncbi:hypothetical protein MAR_013969 [Mya arenaria]|uniref:Uncharacterized protein n=1 Tax=Mya arenaria TaxID=6604 RepID=A0ABY7G1G4_MYAAR|nr:hypothetical protein MAR_013969 [Mya arenaria]